MPLAWYARSIASALALVIALYTSLRCFADISLVLALPLLLPLPLLMVYFILLAGGSSLASLRRLVENTPEVISTARGRANNFRGMRRGVGGSGWEIAVWLLVTRQAGWLVAAESGRFVDREILCRL